MKKEGDLFLESYQAYSDAIFRYCFSRLGDREMALDLTQDTFMKTWKFVSSGGTVSNMRAFLYKITGNLVIDEYRKRRNPESLDVLLEESGFEPSSEDHERMIERLDGRDAMVILSKIPEPYKESLVLRFVQGLSLSEISEVIGENQNTIAVRIHRGIAKLNTIFKYE